MIDAYGARGRQVLKTQGVYRKKTEGFHLLLQHPQTGYRTSVPMHPGDLPTGLFLKILKDAGFTLADFRQS
ncbi:MAG: type II toxin-antitoxin system HicA family toxin [Candidatus Binatia bacterium]